MRLFTTVLYVILGFTFYLNLQDLCKSKAASFSNKKKKLQTAESFDLFINNLNNSQLLLNTYSAPPWPLFKNCSNRIGGF